MRQAVSKAAVSANHLGELLIAAEELRERFDSSVAGNDASTDDHSVSRIRNAFGELDCALCDLAGNIRQAARAATA